MFQSGIRAFTRGKQYRKVWNICEMSTKKSPPKDNSESEWRAILDPVQFAVLREKATEKPGSGRYNNFFEDGIYRCVACGQPLYKSKTKFQSGCGWPAFFEGIPGSIDTHTDKSHGMERTEITCSSCGGHLGHVFKGEGFSTPTDERHCVNSVCLKFTPSEGKE